jgi:hypothetical protein
LLDRARGVLDRLHQFQTAENSNTHKMRCFEHEEQHLQKQFQLPLPPAPLIVAVVV